MNDGTVLIEFTTIGDVCISIVVKSDVLALVGTRGHGVDMVESLKDLLEEIWKKNNGRDER